MHNTISTECQNELRPVRVLRTCASDWDQAMCLRDVFMVYPLRIRVAIITGFQIVASIYFRICNIRREGRCRRHSRCSGLQGIQKWYLWRFHLAYPERRQRLADTEPMGSFHVYPRQGLSGALCLSGFEEKRFVVEQGNSDIVFGA